VFDTKTKSSTPEPGSVRPDHLAAAPPLRRLPGRNWTKADVLFFRLDGKGVAVKDYGPRPLLVRQTIGRLLTRREAAAYRAAGGVEGLPRFLGRLGPWTLALEWIEGKTLADLRGEALDEGIFDRIGAILESLHARGIAAGDLHHRDVLVGPGRSVHLVDLATALVLGRRPGRFRRAAFARLAAQDLVALARMRARWTGRDEAAAIAAVGKEAAAWYARGRRLRRFWDRLRGRRASGSR
jgi:hypothetical protein